MKHVMNASPGNACGRKYEPGTYPTHHTAKKKLFDKPSLGRKNNTQNRRHHPSIRFKKRN